MMKTTIDILTGDVVCDFPNGERLVIARELAKRYGLGDIIRQTRYSHLLPVERMPVKQEGRLVGTLPPDFCPFLIRSTSFLYSPRPDDFVWDGEAWIAARMLGPGDMEAVPGFERA